MTPPTDPVESKKNTPFGVATVAIMTIIVVEGGRPSGELKRKETR